MTRGRDARDIKGQDALATDYGIGRRPTQRMLHLPLPGKPGAGRGGQPVQPAAIMATAVRRPPLPGR
ncbi:MAG: hypothetical protein A2Z25_12160 [Planctomycetes bacterium RBG_16_55_9]|nr:MAG: hypothetical protein A2Z25_12160 [Planctomycetes bacterium RBG_16_55_9]